ncbi:WD40/YVTN/BNR-like repeat-containing protein [Tenacibaculum jejuense]|uniref:Probable lipoprotein n=1 Tax=Tenacibaculum jejuense TaxID=584609 RepID=A0A238UAJ0_9FLAO|nr:hypothetical protein [Tenacibaculum jejuense]SNR15494.1 Probable lipoprotein precursor [Tenacibaculum jejuense]
MKKIVYLAVISAIILFSCSKENGITGLPILETNGNVSFGFKISANRGLINKAIANETPVALIISVVDENDETVFENKRHELINFNGSFLTEDIELKTGTYRLTAFNVINSDNEVILSTPITGSDFADLVQNPLPIEFTIDEDASITVTPEVLRVNEDDTAESFGYVSFGFDIVETQNLFITLINESVTPNVSIDGSIEIKINDINFTTTKDLEVGVNKIRIPLVDNSSEINFIITSDSFSEQTLNTNSDEINNTSSSNPLEISFGEAPSTTIIPDTSPSERLELVISGVTNSSSTEILDVFSDIENFGDKTYAIGTDAGFSNIIEISRNPAGTNIDYTYYRFPDSSINLLRLVRVGDYLIASAYGGDLYKINIIDKNYVKYSYLSYSDNFADNIYALNNTLYAHQGNELYKSEDFGATFEIVNNNLPFASSFPNSSDDQKRKLLAINSTIYGIESPFLYKSTDGGATFEVVMDGMNDTNELYEVNGNIVVAGNNSVILFSPFNDEWLGAYSPKTEDGNFLNVAGVDGETRVFFENAVYDNSIFTFDGVGTLDPIRTGNYNLTDVITSTDFQQIYGIGGNTLYLELR